MSDQPIPAASLILVRDPLSRSRRLAPEAPPEPLAEPLPELLPELLMVERSPAMVFAGGALVFPGGRIDAADYLLAERFDLPDAAARIAAIRETIEETAVPAALDPLPSPGEALAMQAALAAGGDFAELLGAAATRLDLAALVPFAHWLPPSHVVHRRFDTLFYLTQAPAGAWQPSFDPGECSDACWLGSAETLRRADEGAANLIFPTRRILERLGGHADYAAIRAHAAAFPVERVSPWLVERDGQQWLRIPDHLGYPVTESRFDR